MAQTASVEELLKAGAHFGHLTRRWNPKMREFIFMQRNGIHIIDLKKTHKHLEESLEEVSKIARSGKDVLFVGTKKQAQDIIKTEADRCGMPYITDRWLGGMLTNFVTMKKSISRMEEIKAMRTDGTYENITKKERLMLDREQEKLERVLFGISKMSKLPGAIFIVDIVKERIAVNEALKLNIPIFAMVDTNCDPDVPDHIIPANDDAAKSIQLIASNIADAIVEGSAEREAFKEQQLAQDAVEEGASAEGEDLPASEEDVKKARPKRSRRKRKQESDEANTQKGKENQTESQTGDAAEATATVEEKAAPEASDEEAGTEKEASGKKKQKTASKSDKKQSEAKAETSEQDASEKSETKKKAASSSKEKEDDKTDDKKAEETTSESSSEEGAQKS